MEGMYDTGGSGDDYAGILGVGCRYIGIENVGQYRVYTANSGWLPYVDHFDRSDEEWGMAGDGSSILGLEIPNPNIKYQVHTVNGGWLPWMVGNSDTGGSSDFFAGDLNNPIDGICIVNA